MHLSFFPCTLPVSISLLYILYKVVNEEKWEWRWDILSSPTIVSHTLSALNVSFKSTHIKNVYKYHSLIIWNNDNGYEIKKISKKKLSRKIIKCKIIYLNEKPKKLRKFWSEKNSKTIIK
jgi:hypothetical protein